MNRYRSTPFLAVLAALVVVLAACSSDASPSASPSAEGAEAAEETAAVETEAPVAASEPATADGEGAEVRIVASIFESGELTVSVGTEVVFINDDNFAHTISEGTDGDVVDDPIVDEEIEGGSGEVRVTFDEAGTFDITCEIHPTIQITITVEG